MILLTGLYRDADSRRQEELIDCLRRNMKNDRLDEIHVFVEDDRVEPLLTSYAQPDSSKTRLIQHGRRVTYRDLFAYAAERLTNCKVIIANADIFFDDSLACLDRYDLPDKFLCLSRWDVQPDGSARFFEHPSSQDAWIFQAPLREFPSDFHLGVLGCDNRLAWEAESAGLTVSNPSRSVRAYHLHLSGIRRYNNRQRLSGPAKSVPAVFLESVRSGRRQPIPQASCASVAFRESMGYTVARLEIGVSSHNNEPRPFTEIAEPLIGRQFTQVVASSVSPVEVEFLSQGKLFVLVGDDWDGYNLATSWLYQEGYREDLPSAKTQLGTGFEVWSLVGEAGQRYVLPTQVMLVAGQLTRNDGPSLSGGLTDIHSSAVASEAIYALTSLPPSPESAPFLRTCIESWRAAGLKVRAFNTAAEIAELSRLYNVDFVPVSEATLVSGKHFIPIKAMLDWGREQDAPVLLINADIQLRMKEWELKRVRWLADGGLCYFVRYNHDGNIAQAAREPHGIDAFLLHGRDAGLFQESSLSMGQPFWDYWLPHTFGTNGRPIYTVEFPTAFHRNHRARWSWTNWHLCALEFARISEEACGDGSFEACVAMSLRMRQNFDRQKVSVTPVPFRIREWVQQTFRYPGPKLFLELGAHQGTDTAWMAALPNVTIHAFEPDPRNHQPPRPNVTLHRAAVGGNAGVRSLILSKNGWGQQWTHSSSIKQPKNHLTRFPVTFGEAIDVECVTLDGFREKQKLDLIDFIWADIQGAEGEMIRGAAKTLSRTRYLYTEYSDDELYENQMPLSGILKILPDFRVIELWPDDVLLENRKLKI